MGSTPSSPKSSESPPPVDLRRPDNLRASLRTRVPMPADQAELERRFTKVLASMDLPPDKAKLLKQYDDEKKWDLICDQERVQAKETPAYYLNKLRTYLDPKASRSSRKRKMLGDATSTQVLRDLEISLRTNHIEWVREFLNQENRGLDSLVDYLSFRLIMMRHELISSRQDDPPINDSFLHNIWSGGREESGCAAQQSNMDSLRRRSRHAARLRMGDTKDDIHLCIMSLRAIMNNKYGFNMVIQHTEAINCIALSLIHKSLRTKALVLELLAAICWVKGGHEIILAAFDNFKEMCQEKCRFHTLMQFFINYDIFHIEFMVACMQFVNIIVHSVDDMNYRVHLQYEFTKLGLDEYLDKLRRTESDELQVQISAYLDNVFDVAALMEDSETKTTALEKVADLEDELSHTVEKLGEVERESMRRVASLEQALAAARAEREQLVEGKLQAETEVATLRRVVQRSSVLSPDMPPPPPPDSCSSSSGVSSCSDGSGMPPPPPPPPPPATAAPPPPPPPPSAPRLPHDHLQAMTIKRKVQTKYKLPTLNWIALKPNQVRGTIFNELDDEKLHTVIDFSEFEEKFKLCGNGGRGTLSNADSMTDGLSSFPSKRFKKPDNISLLEHARLRNIAISRRKMDMPVERLICAVNTFDLKTVPLESVELLSKMVPNEPETKAYREYVSEKKDVNLLTEEDKFMLQLTRVERLAAKLSIMNYIGNFHDNIHLITPQVQAVLAASKSVRSSKRLVGVLEVVLVFGNYLNSSKRGPAYGFKLQSLDTLLETKSNDKRLSLLHYIVGTIHAKLPHLLNFDTELMYIDKASLVCMENVLMDVTELEKGMEAVKRESEARKERVLRDFLANSEERLRRLRQEAKAAHDALASVLEYFGESVKGTDANTFFLLLVRFVKAFKVAEQENEQRKRLEAAARQALNNNNHDQSNNKLNKLTNHKRQQDAVINELKSKTKMVQEKKLLHQDEVYNGALEDILLGLRSEPYRRADAVRRSQRRRIDSNRLSRTYDEIDV